MAWPQLRPTTVNATQHYDEAVRQKIANACGWLTHKRCLGDPGAIWPWPAPLRKPQQDDKPSGGRGCKQPSMGRTPTIQPRR
eukprot:11097826-Lingulodinium_polyedra.AAC.1